MRKMYELNTIISKISIKIKRLNIQKINQKFQTNNMIKKKFQKF
jgi:hypothetical protein